MLGDVGGLLDGLRLIGSLVMFFFHLIRGDPLQDFLLKALFKRGEKEKSDGLDLQEGLLWISWRRPFSSKSCFCLKTKKERRLHQRGWDRIEKALDIE